MKFVFALALLVAFVAFISANETSKGRSFDLMAFVKFNFLN